MHCFLRHTARLSGLQRVPSWFSSVQSVITVAGWLHYSMCISQHFQCFPCVVSFLLYSDSLKLCALQKQLKTLCHQLDTWLSVFTVLSLSESNYIMNRTGYCKELWQTRGHFWGGHIMYIVNYYLGIRLSTNPMKRQKPTMNRSY